MFNNYDFFKDADKLTESKIDMAIEQVLEKLKKHIPYFGKWFKPEASVGNVYGVLTDSSWVASFYTGSLWLAYELSGDEIFRKTAESHLPFFERKINEKIALETHDLGFLYTLSCVAEYKITGNEKAKDLAIEAAKFLAVRFKEKGQFIQAWGKLDNKNEYRLIVDCLLNLPLLYWAAKETGNEHFSNIALAHLNSTTNVAVREDGSTYHTYFFNPETGEPECGRTHQGYMDESAWARGQAWCIYGFILSNSYFKNSELSQLWEKVTDYYLENLPDDKIAYWDFTFKDGDEPRDSSSNVIAVCGILEAYRQGVCGREYLEAAKSMLNAVIDKCTTDENSNGLITHSTYHRDNGADECTPWGDYYYLEALVRLKKDWKMYW